LRTVSFFTRLITAACAVATVTLLVAAPGGSAASLKPCSLSLTKSQQLGATYVTKLKVQGVSCSTAQRVVKSFHSCRKQKGVAGRCTHRVKGYSCTDTRPASLQIPTQLNGQVKCRSASKRVNFDYQQNK
jgi:hypothetical protein